MGYSFRLGQVRASCCSACRVLCPGQDKKRGGGGGGWRLYGGTACTGGYKGAQAVRPGSVAGKGVLGVMEFGMSHRIKPKEKYMHISMNTIWSYMVILN